MKNIFLIIALIFIQISVLTAQNDLNKALHAELILIGRSSPDSIILRWGVSKAAVWEDALNKGYIIERAEYDPNVSDYEKLNYKPISTEAFKVWPITRWENIFNSMDEEDEDYQYAALAVNLSGVANFESGQKSTSLFSDGLNSLGEGKSITDNRYGFCMVAADRSAITAEALGLRTTDTDIAVGKTYVYRISLASYGGKYFVKPAYLKIKAEDFNPIIDKSKLVITPKHESIMMTWERPAFMNSFFIERSFDGNSYIRLNEAPLNRANHPAYYGKDLGAYLDENLLNYNTYYYRIYGATSFGDELLMAEFSAMPKDMRAPSKPFINQPEHIQPDEVSVTWEWTDDGESADLNGFNILRGKDVHGPFDKLNSDLIDLQLREYNDEEFIADGKNYYVIEAVDASGNVSSSRAAYVTLIDSIPPAVPEFLDGKMDSTGVVTLVLKPNTERDLMGYRILFSNQEDHEFSVIQDRFDENIDTYQMGFEFKDTVSLNTLTKYVYYKATSLDYNYNESELSHFIRVKRPDNIPPVPPLIKGYKVSEDNVVLDLVPSTSDDVVSHSVYRKESDQTDWSIISIVGKEVSIFKDTTVSEGIDYHYSISATDDSDNESRMCNPVKLRKVEKIDFKGPEPTAKYDLENKFIEITWESAENRSTKYVLSRMINSGKWEILSIGEDNFFIDEDLDVQGNYLYRLKSYSHDLESIPIESEWLVIK